MSRTSRNFEVGLYCLEDKPEPRFLLEFPGHIDRDHEGDPILTESQLQELQLLIASLVAECRGIL